MDYMKNIGILVFSICLIFLPFSSIAQICSGASANQKSIALSSMETSSQSGKKAGPQKYTYYDAEYDDAQNNLLAVQSLIERYTADISDLSEEFLFVMHSFDAKVIQSGLAKDWAVEKDVLEKALKVAGNDEEIQRQALQEYYFFLDRQLQDDTIQQFVGSFAEFQMRFEQLKKMYSEEAKNNPYGYKLTENMNTKKLNPSYEECRSLLAVASKVKTDLDKMQNESLRKTRKKQILDRHYEGIVGKWQKLSDFVTGKGKFAK
ncbi:MAG: hypothetical protein HRU09_10695 [Oligoflexales bacterium]|nr:hypothetical protein [Oligoflexales bacterium]